MKLDPERAPRLETLLAGGLQWGAGAASATIAVGLAPALIDLSAGTQLSAVWPGERVVTAGVALFILLPILRVALMLGAFLRRRDYRFGAIAALVLLNIFLGFVVAMRMASAAP